MALKEQLLTLRIVYDDKPDRNGERTNDPNQWNWDTIVFDGKNKDQEHAELVMTAPPREVQHFFIPRPS